MFDCSNVLADEGSSDIAYSSSDACTNGRLCDDRAQDGTNDCEQQSNYYVFLFHHQQMY